MREPKFKFGDKVRVLRASTEVEHNLWMDGWMPSMNYAIGKVKTINYVNPNGDLYPKYRFENTGMYFPEFVLQKLNIIGEQRMFGFMGVCKY